VRLDTNKMAPLDVKDRDGVRLLPLFKDAHEDVRLEQWATGATIEFGGLEVLALEGGFREGGETYGAQSWLRLPIGAHFRNRGVPRCNKWSGIGNAADPRRPVAGPPPLTHTGLEAPRIHRAETSDKGRSVTVT
jgi:hypothetical protein